MNYEISSLTSKFQNSYYDFLERRLERRLLQAADSNFYCTIYIMYLILRNIIYFDEVFQNIFQVPYRNENKQKWSKQYNTVT